jgi:60 kDa SS-A/Ro ribonucleoprotein
MSGDISRKIKKVTSQTTPVPGMVENNAGGYVFKINEQAQLVRFLILGSERPTYYCDSRKLTTDNASNLLNCIKNNGLATVRLICDISKSGRAPKNSPALFALAAAAAHGDLATRIAAYSVLPQVARIGTHLFEFAHYSDALRDWGSGLRKAIANFYTKQPVDNVAYQILKYKSRVIEEGVARSAWSHKDLLRKVRPTPPNEVYSDLYKYIIYGKTTEKLPKLINVYEEMQKADDVKKIVDLVTQNSAITHEMIPKKFAGDPEIWEALLPNLPMTALIRTLGRLTKYGVLKPLSKNVSNVVARITDVEQLKDARIHPIHVLIAMNTYSKGEGTSSTWVPIPQINNALDEAFRLSFKTVEPTNKRFYLGLDVSGSMRSNPVRNLPLTARDVCAAMSLIMAKTEPNYYSSAFSSDLVPFAINSNDTVNSVITRMSAISFGATNPASIILDAQARKMPVDAFVVYTDNEANLGTIKPHEALKQYRQSMGIDAKLICVAATATEYSVADPNDAGSMDVVGFDSAVPQLISEFVSGF